MLRLLNAATMIALGAALIGCPQNTATDPQQIVFPDTLVSYRSHVAPFLALACGQCHGSATAAGGIILTDYSSLFFSRPNLVVKYAPEESLLNQVLEQTIAHPVGNLQVLPSNQVVGMRVWVAEGALNN